MVSSRRLERHFRKIHGIAPAAPLQDEEPSQIRSIQNDIETTYELCPKCGAKVRRDRINTHIAKVHRTVVARPTVTRTRDSGTAGIAGFVKKLREAKASMSGLTRSLISNVHNSPNPALRQIESSVQSSAESQKLRHTFEVCMVCKAKVKATRIGKHMAKVHKRRAVRTNVAAVRSSKNLLRQNTILIAPRDKNLDATKLYAHPCREQGRYGSHPSHDGFDDESTPD
jgi:uncharacterized protein with PIN domain